MAGPARGRSMLQNRGRMKCGPPGHLDGCWRGRRGASLRGDVPSGHLTVQTNRSAELTVIFIQAGYLAGHGLDQIDQAPVILKRSEHLANRWKSSLRIIHIRRFPTLHSRLAWQQLGVHVRKERRGKEIILSVKGIGNDPRECVCALLDSNCIFSVAKLDSTISLRGKMTSRI